MASFVDDPASAGTPAPPTSASASQQQRADESDLDPAAFLKSVRELSEKREREDAERYRKLELEIEKSREQRAARRAERARSISPEKTDTPILSALRSSGVNTSVPTPPPMTPPSSSGGPTDSSESQPPQTMSEEIPEFRGFGSGSRSSTSTPSAIAEPASRNSPSASSLARSGTLSWQQRPRSRGGNSRPLSMVSTESSSQARSTPTEEPEQSREQIAASLGSRDPTWFKQTADRGVGNAAFRKSKDDSATGDNFVSGRRGLPGMSRETSAEPVPAASPPPSESFRSDTASRTGSMRDSGISSSRFSATRTSTSSKPDLKSLIAADEGQDKASPMSERTSSTTDGDQSSLGRTPTMSSSQARLASATERPASPTKGMGGFVQSAMMKRSDSANKRWSQQQGSSLNRQNSAASARSGYGGLAGSHSMPRLEPTSNSRETSNEPASRPTSSSSNNLANLALSQGREDNDGFIKPALPHHTRSKSVASNYSTTAEEGHTSPPASPSKRWSPTKSSWLESAITKPETPKPAASPRNSQPSWMADIAKAKAQRASAESTPKLPAAEDAGSRPTSPTKAAFGQSMLRRTESKDLGTPRSASPTKGLDLPSTAASSELKDAATPPAVDTKVPDAVVEPEQQPPTKPVPLNIKKDGPPKPIASAKKFEPSESPSERPAEAAKPIPPPTMIKPKAEIPSKPQTDFRSNLRSRVPSEAKQQETPEFLSKFGNLKKTTTQNYVAPDVLKDNILRGKGDLTKTGGPVKTQRRDELKESLLAKKEQWKQEKEAGVVHERKVSGPPQTPQKPEALARRELLGRSDSTKGLSASPEKPKDATPEALSRHKSLKSQSKIEPPFPSLEKQASAPLETTPAVAAPTMPKKQTSTPLSSSTPETSAKATETSKLAARFNPGLAGMLARGPPAMTNGSNPPSRSETPSNASNDAPAEGGQLQDVRKGRAKGPKRRKRATREMTDDEPSAPVEQESIPEAAQTISPPAIETVQVGSDETAESAPLTKPKPRAPPGSAASLMVASLQKSQPPAPTNTDSVKPSTPLKSPGMSTPKLTAESSSTPAKSPAVSSLGPSTPASKPLEPKPLTPFKSPAILSKAASSQDDTISTPLPRDASVPEFKGFGSSTKSRATAQPEENKENIAESTPSVKSAASQWGRQSPTKKPETPSQIQLPSKKDEEAAMRSAGLLASSPSRPGSRSGLGITAEKESPASMNMPPKPTKSSRAVSGQLQEASANKGPSDSAEQPQNDIERKLFDMFGSIPRIGSPLSIETQAVISSSPHQERSFKTVRKIVQLLALDGSLKQLPPQEEYIFFDESVYIFTHSYTVANGPKKTEIFLWAGSSSTEAALENAQATAKKLAKEAGNASIHTTCQGLEPPGFLQALGGILVTRSGSRENASKRYMLCGRKHVGQIVFDEVDFEVTSLCAGFAYLICYPVTLQDIKLYLWKGPACSTEEISAARLAAMDLSETGEIIEVDGGAEFASFLKVFGAGTTKASVPKATQLWQQKSQTPEKFATRLFRIRQPEAKASIFSSMFRRPSWNNLSPARKQEDEIFVEAKELSPFTQSDLDPDGIYLLDAHSAVYVLIGPLFPALPESPRNVLFGQALLFASKYAALVTSSEERASMPISSVVLSGIPEDLKTLFRHWEDSHGLWGTGELMVGSQANRGGEVSMLSVDDVLGAVCTS